MKLDFDFENEIPKAKARMKFDVLHEFREYLNGMFKKNTANTYYFSIKKLFDYLDFNAPEQISLEEIKRRILNLKTTDDINTVQAALLQWKNCFPIAQIPDEDFMATANQGKSHGQTYFP